MFIPLYQVDAFSDRPFGGNPAAVCLLEAMPADDWLQAVAAEMNLSETAYLVREGDGFRLRWFTPLVEVDLCGHATLASAHVLWQHRNVPREAPIRFFTRSGELRATCRDGRIWLDFPSSVCTPCEPPEGLLSALGVSAVAVGKTKFDYLVEVEREAIVRRLTPDFRALSKVAARGIIVTSRATTEGIDFVSRFFAPAAGVDEDPVTGSAHCALGPYWHAQLGRATLVGWQASVRGGEVLVDVRGERTWLGGKAVTVVRGELEA